MKKLITSILGLFMIFTLVGCGNSAPDISGKYTCTEISFDGETFEAYDTENSGESYLELKTGGKGIYYDHEEEFEMTYKLDGETFSGEVQYFGEATKMTGTYKDGTIEVSYIDYWKRFKK